MSQWVDELGSKFGLAAVVAESGKVGPDDEIWHRALSMASAPLVRQRTGHHDALERVITMV